MLMCIYGTTFQLTAARRRLVVSLLILMVLLLFQLTAARRRLGQQRKGILGAIAERLLAEASKNEGGGL